MSIDLGRVDELEPARVEAGRPEERDLDAVGRSLERAGDDLVRGAIAAQRVDRDAGPLRRLRRSGSTSRPL